MIDYGHLETEKQIRLLEDRISRVYKQSYLELGEVVKSYFSKFTERDAEMKKRLDEGKIDESQYISWRMTQMARGRGFQRMRDDVAQRMYAYNSQAIDYINNAAPAAYAVNRNWAAYTIEATGKNIAFNLWDETTVKRLLKEDPQLMPNYPEQRAIDRGIDLAYSKKIITNDITAGIITGKSIGQIADGLQDHLSGMGRTSAVRAARTAMTGAQSAGRVDTYDEAISMGIPVKKQWMCTLDMRTRHSHAMLDGESVDNDKKFSNGCRYPGDPEGTPGEVYNCRCTLIADIAGSAYKDARRAYRRKEVNGEETYTDTTADITYKEWYKAKQKQQQRNRGFNKAEAKNTSSAESESNDVIKDPKQSTDEKFNELLEGVQSESVEYIAVENHKESVTEDGIIQAISGGDKTSGSCASVALAYIGQKQGWNVLDYRDGASRKFFRRSGNLRTISEMQGMKVFKAEGASSLTVGNRLLKQCEIGKEYYLCVGKHAAIVRAIENDVIDPDTGEVLKIEKKLQYLELQSASKCGWIYFNGNPRYTLSNRFGCSSASDGGFSSSMDFLLDIEDSDFNTTDFRTLLGYLNTAESNQRKGSSGTIK